jgi:trigger factor
VQLRGFRPGKVPVTHLKKIYGKAVMAETIEAVIRELNAKIVSDRGLKLAMEPKVTLPNEGSRGRQGDRRPVRSSPIRSRSRSCPRSSSPDFKGIKLDRLVAEVSDDQVKEAVDKIAEQKPTVRRQGGGAKVEKGDRVVIDFTGKIDGVPFEGGSGGDIGVNVGSGNLHSGL